MPEADRSALFRRRCWGAFRGALSFGLLVFLFIAVDFSDLAAVLVNVHLDLLILYLTLPLLNMMIAAYRQYLLLNHGDRSIQVGAVIRLIFTSSFLGRLVPGSVGVEVLRIYGITKRTGNFALALTAILVDRVLAMLALLGLVLVGVALQPPGLPQAIETAAWLSLGALLVGATVIMLPSFRRLSLALLPTKFAPLRGWITNTYQLLDEFQRQPGLLLRSFSIGLVFQVMRCIIPALGLAAFSASVPFAFVMAVMPIVILITLLPISIAGLGVYEAAFVYFFSLVGVAPEVSLTVSLVGRVSWVLTALPGAWIYARRGLMS